MSTPRERSEGRRSKASTPSVPASPPPPVAKLPQHFSATFEYQGERKAGPSWTSSPKVSTSSTSPRRSPRAKQARFANLLSAYSDLDDDDGYQPKSNGSSPSKGRSKQMKEAGSSDDDASQGQNGAKKSKSRKRIRRTRDDPNSAAGSIYAHLKGLPDLFAEHNDIMFCGINPGVKSSHSGHHFAHRSNHFYPSLHLAGITEERMKPEQDVEFPTLRPLSLGLTNLAPRPTAEGNELLPSELIDGVPTLLEKVRRWKPRTVCFVGKGISEAFMKGLKQAGAIDKGSSSIKKGRGSRKASAKATAPKSECKIKREEMEVYVQLPVLGSENDELDTPTFLQAAVPADVLCAFDPPAAESQDVKPTTKGTSPQKAKKQLYTKGNAKDDTGYGILPICVPHSQRKGSPLRLDQVTLFFVTPSSSARVTTHFLDDKARILKSLRRLVEHLEAAGTRANGSTNGNVKLECGSGSLVKLESDVPQTTTEIELEVVDVSRFSRFTASSSMG
ncbi:uncharacterized protein SRS1_15218 [Sporisorium reilianum f. sp. reilianum]|uniref:Uracil-DNA glycosylase-like domain-containing protein n=1 Tax=Sporisorium reilianum f. sp. reilianum TaxID=72559 RepID=A0A2N8UJW7_9BASI|nr:uncharacterized protein SRS1_15218 [Sporisorium reilianum f. sp. reilianum]